MSEPNGIKARQDYYSGVAKVDDPTYLQAATDFATFLTTYTNGGNADLIAGTPLPASMDAMRPAGMSPEAQNVQWQDAADMIHSGRAAMFLHGDWVESYLTSKGDAIGQDFDVVQFPPKAFVYAGDSFVMAKDAPHHDAALAFLKTVGNPDVQSAFNKAKGSLPARTDADTSMLGTFGQQSAMDFADPSVTLVPCSWDYAPVDYWNCWGDAMEGIMMDHDPVAFAKACVDKYPLLKQ